MQKEGLRLKSEGRKDSFGSLNRPAIGGEISRAIWKKNRDRIDARDFSVLGNRSQWIEQPIGRVSYKLRVELLAAVGGPVSRRLGEFRTGVSSRYV